MSADKYIFIETLIAVAFSIVFNVGIGWLALNGLDPITLFGLPGLGIGLLPATLMTCLMVTLAATLITRGRQRRSAAPSLPPAKPKLPRHALQRAVLVGAIATAVLAPLAAGGLSLTWPGPYTLMEALAINAGYAVVLAVLVAPIVLRETLREVAA